MPELKLAAAKASITAFKSVKGASAVDLTVEVFLNRKQDWEAVEALVPLAGDLFSQITDKASGYGGAHVHSYSQIRPLTIKVVEGDQQTFEWVDVLTSGQAVLKMTPPKGSKKRAKPAKSSLLFHVRLKLTDAEMKKLAKVVGADVLLTCEASQKDIEDMTKPAA